MATAAEAQVKEQKKVQLAFDLADVPVKEWISEYLGEDLDILYPGDADGETEVVVTTHKGKSYVFSLTCYPDDETKTFPFTPAEVKESESLSKAFEQLFEAVYRVWPAVVGTIDIMGHRLAGILPYLDGDRHAFTFRKVNGLGQQKAHGHGQFLEAHDKMELLEKAWAEKKVPEEKYEELRGMLEKVILESKESTDITQAEITALDEECAKFNAQSKEYPPLYIYIQEEAEVDDDRRLDLVMKRMPQIGGEKYRSPDDGTSIIDEFQKDMAKELDSIDA
jgi:hypothetical protein